jgi:hypothetical protein
MFEASGSIAFFLLALGTLVAWSSFQGLSAEPGPMGPTAQFPPMLLWIGLAAGVLMLGGGAKLALDAAAFAASSGGGAGGFCITG